MPDDLIAGPLTFMGVRHTLDLARSKAAVLGVPFDCGIHPFRVGARQGPQSIREQSRLVRPFQADGADLNPLEALGLVDCGDVRLTPGRIRDAFARIEAAMAPIVAAGVVPVTMGGDGSVSLPQLRALRRRYDNLAVIHVDSHTDAYPPDPAEPYDASTQFTHAAEEGLIDVAHSYHVGLRGPASVHGIFARARTLGYQVITFDAVMTLGVEPTAIMLRDHLLGRPVYLCFDMDVFDPSCAPGVATPVWGGWHSREGLAFLRALKGLDIVAIDVNTVSPPHDVQGMTAFLAARVIYEALGLLCR